MEDFMNTMDYIVTLIYTGRMLSPELHHMSNGLTFEILTTILQNLPGGWQRQNSACKTLRKSVHNGKSAK